MAADPLVMMLFVSFFMGAIIALLLVVAWFKLSRLGKALVVWIDGDGRAVNVSYHRPREGEIEYGNRRFLLDGLAKHGGRYSTWLVDVATGWNYRAPTRAEKFEAKPLPANPDGNVTPVPQLAVLEASNPKSYYKAHRRYRWNDLLQAGDDSNKHAWIFPVAILALVAFVVLIGMVGYIMTKLPTPAGG